MADAEAALRDQAGADDQAARKVALSLTALGETLDVAEEISAADLSEAEPQRLDELTRSIREIEKHAGWYLTLPAWARIQSVHTAALGVWSAVSDAIGAETRLAAAHWRVALSAAACRSIARSASHMAAELTRRGAGGTPAWRGLRHLSRQADRLASSALGRPADLATVRQQDLREAAVVVAARQDRVERIAPRYSGRRTAVAGSRRIVSAFLVWSGSAMGRELIGSQHPRVAALRRAWQSLPPADPPGRPHLGRTALPPGRRRRASAGRCRPRLGALRGQQRAGVGCPGRRR
ncbi:hypothetical protein P3T36_007656 [Kitasatospora sp. MAP12-15]|uniref:hypothetical protein n=1 Tax=unclassified Kitasatospora TaxID=2633591 RepID=UPI0024737566|nr:hypothetical protein [Kitasatospora sp. MAP12-44]MDH6115679.1 hypothetical protein [Kitasatospora sp. MAP12-44]